MTTSIMVTVNWSIRESHLEPVIARGEPLIDRAVEGITGLDIVKNDDRKHESRGNPEDGRRMREPARESTDKTDPQLLRRREVKNQRHGN